jgi:hypothetical protein
MFSSKLARVIAALVLAEKSLWDSVPFVAMS